MKLLYLQPNSRLHHIYKHSLFIPAQRNLFPGNQLNFIPKSVLRNILYIVGIHNIAVITPKKAVIWELFFKICQFSIMGYLFPIIMENKLPVSGFYVTELMAINFSNTGIAG